MSHATLRGTTYWGRSGLRHLVRRSYGPPRVPKIDAFPYLPLAVIPRRAGTVTPMVRGNNLREISILDPVAFVPLKYLRKWYFGLFTKNIKRFCARYQFKS